MQRMWSLFGAKPNTRMIKRRKLNDDVNKKTNRKTSTKGRRNRSQNVRNDSIRCLFCTRRFIDVDDYFLHYAEKHVKEHGPCPDEANSPQEENTNEANAENSNTSRDLNNATLNKEHRRSCELGVSYKDPSEDDYRNPKAVLPTVTSFHRRARPYTETHENEDDKTLGIKDVPLQEPGPSSSNLLQKANSYESAQPSRKRRKSSIELNESDSTFFSDTSLESNIQNIVNTCINNLGEQIIEYIKNEIIKEEIHPKIMLYKCRKCSLYFKSNLVNEKYIDTQQPQCDHLMLQLAENSLQRYIKTYIRRDLDKKITRTSAENDNVVNEIDISDSDDDTQINNSAHSHETSAAQSSNRPVEKASKPKEENVENDVVVTKNRPNVNKVILYACDDCDEHFLSKKTAERHIKRLSHFHETYKKTICDQCTYKFSCAATLSQHKHLHHIERNLSKDDFKVITVSKYRFDRIQSSQESNSNLQRIQVKQKHSPEITAVRLFMYVCEGCNQSLTTNKSLLKHIKKCKGKIPSKYFCEKCQLYFATKHTFAKHLAVHEKHPLLTKEDFIMRSCYPKNHKSISMHLSAIVSAIEENVDDFLIDQQQPQNTNVSENDMCKIKHSSTENSCSMVKQEAESNEDEMINIKNEYSYEHEDANKNNSKRDTCHNINHHIEDKNQCADVKSDRCHTNTKEDLRIKVEPFEEEIQPENCLVSGTRNNISDQNINNNNISAIENIYSVCYVFVCITHIFMIALQEFYRNSNSDDIRNEVNEKAECSVTADMDTKAGDTVPVQTAADIVNDHNDTMKINNNASSSKKAIFSERFIRNRRERKRRKPQYNKKELEYDVTINNIKETPGNKGKNRNTENKESQFDSQDVIESDSDSENDNKVVNVCDSDSQDVIESEGDSENDSKVGTVSDSDSEYVIESDSDSENDSKVDTVYESDSRDVIESESDSENDRKVDTVCDSDSQDVIESDGDSENDNKVDIVCDNDSQDVIESDRDTENDNKVGIVCDNDSQDVIESDGDTENDNKVGIVRDNDSQEVTEIIDSDDETNDKDHQKFYNVYSNVIEISDSDGDDDNEECYFKKLGLARK